MKNIVCKNCKNCNKYGHYIYNCRYPIISYGIIAYKYNSFKQIYDFLLIRRKHTHGFNDFVRGKYNINNKKLLLNLLSEMTNDELILILSNNFDKLWDTLWDNNNIIYLNDYNYSKNKYNELFTLNIIDDLISSLTHKWTEAEWGFPKGKRDTDESDLKCALREWNEETGVNTSNINIINNISTFNEIYMASNYLTYQTNYYLAECNNNIILNINKCDNKEVSDIKWASLDECIKLIRPYNIEKKNLIKNINNILNNNNNYITIV